METVKFTLRLPRELHEWFRNRAFATRESMHALMLQALTRGGPGEERQVGSNGHIVSHDSPKKREHD